MKKSYNLNYIWSKFFVDQLVSYGLKHVCISPGSRSTPLTTAFAENNKIKKYVIVDERSSAFFALGVAKQTNSPVAIVTTSGTAAANLYPAIIEAYQQRMPLIICTTDRPESLRGSGANQTINQKDLYRNHIRFGKDVSLPKLSIKSFKSLQKIIYESLNFGLILDRGPVHLNFQFDKPLEKKVKKVEIEDQFLNKINNLDSPPLPHSSNQSLIPKTILQKIGRSKRGLILVGWDNYEKDFLKKLKKLATHLNFPILADGASGIYLNRSHKNVIVNHQAFLRSQKFVKNNQPEVILLFGNAPTSNSMLDYLKNSSAYKIVVNQFGDRTDSGNPFNKIVQQTPAHFCENLAGSVESKNDQSFLKTFQKVDEAVESNKKYFLKKIKITDEIAIVNKVIESIPAKTNLFVSNSLPIRDLEFFKSKQNKKTKLFVNRGASGIDGINSTAAGIAASSKLPTVLITGDLSFFHDTNGLHTILKYHIPLTVVLINNGGGAIFGMLPIGKEKNIFADYFLTSLNLDFSKLVKTYGANYHPINNFDSLESKIDKSITEKKFTVLEIQTDYKKGIKLRKQYFREVLEKIEKEL